MLKNEPSATILTRGVPKKCVQALVTVTSYVSESCFILCITKMTIAISTMKADRVIKAAKNAISDVIRVELTRDDNANKNAMSAIPAAVQTRSI